MKKIVKKIGIIIVVIALYMGVGSVVPFVRQPDITTTTQESIQTKQWTSDQRGYERACVLENNGDALRERIRMIDHAKERILLSTFEFKSDESGMDVLAALLQAANRGVKVSVLVDGMAATLHLPGNDYFTALASHENAEFKVYNPINPLMPWHFMGRMHDKYLVVDDDVYVLGGRNTYDYFLGDHQGYKNYDWDMLVYQKDNHSGSSLNQVVDYFEEIWELPYCELYKDDVTLKEDKDIQEASQILNERYLQLQQNHDDWFDDVDYQKMTSPTQHVEIVTNPIHRYAKEPVVFYAMTELMSQAKDNVMFHTPYIISNDYMNEQIAHICQNVPHTVMMTNSVVNNGNPFGAMDYDMHKEDLLDLGLNILEYDGGVSYHGKCFTIDDHISAIGSFNWDMRSTYIDTEMMVVIDSEEVNDELREKMMAYEEDALKVIDEDCYDLEEGQSVQKMPMMKKIQLMIMKIFVSWLRFLM